MAVGDFLTWAVQAQDAPAHVARILQTIVLAEGVVDKAGNSFKVAQDTGANMQIKVGSGTLGDLAVVEGDDTAGQGVYVHEAQNATVTRTIAASDPSNPRIDLVVLQNYDDEADSSGLNDAEVEVIQGTPAGSPSAPALPDSAIPLAEVTVGAGVTAITDANITDVRGEAGTRVGPGGVLGYAQRTTNGANVTTITDITGLTVTVDVRAGRRIRITGHGQLSLNASGTETVAAVGYVREGSTVLGRWGTYLDNHSGSRSQLQDGSVIIETSTAASRTFKLSLERTVGAGTVNLIAAADNPAFIVVEDLGPV